jgi:hypothetical protein
VTSVTFGRAPRGTSAAPSDPRVIERLLGSAADIRASA